MLKPSRNVLPRLPISFPRIDLPELGVRPYFTTTKARNACGGLLQPPNLP